MAIKTGRGLSYSAIKKQALAAVNSVAKTAKRSAKPRKKALLIGINDYKTIGDLRGCLNDVKNIGDALQKYCGFSGGNIKTLTDSQASTVKMKAGITALVAGAIPGDVLYLHYSGHGSQVPDKNGDEKDNWDEILCSWDLDWNHPPLDDWLRATFSTLPKGVNLTVGFDSCHSGSATRKVINPFMSDAKKSRDRYVASPWEIQLRESGHELKGKKRNLYRKLTEKAKKRGSDVTAINVPDVMISGCRDDQTSADAYISGSYNGAMTYYLVQALKAKKGKVSNRELHAETLQRVKDGDYSQRPQLTASKTNLDLPFLAPYL